MEIAIWYCISERERQQLAEFQLLRYHAELRPPGYCGHLEKDLARVMSERPRTDFHEVGK